MKKTEKRRHRIIFHFVVYGFIIVILVPSLLFFSGCPSLEPFEVVYPYTFTVDGDYVSWDTETFHEGSLSYNVLIKREGRDTFIYVNSINSGSRVLLTSLGLSDGKNIIRIISEPFFRTYDRSAACSFSNSSNNYIQSVGYWEVFVERDYEISDYEFFTESSFTFGWGGLNELYSVYVNNYEKSIDSFTFIGSSFGTETRRFDNINLTEGGNTIKVERIIKAEYTDKLLLKTSKAYWNFMLKFSDASLGLVRLANDVWNDRDFYYFTWNGEQSSNYRVYLKRHQEKDYSFFGSFRSAVNQGGNVAGLDSMRLNEGRNLIRVSKWVSSDYKEGVLTINRLVGSRAIEVTDTTRSLDGFSVTLGRAHYATHQGNFEAAYALFSSSNDGLFHLHIDKRDGNGFTHYSGFWNSLSISSRHLTCGENIIKIITDRYDWEVVSIAADLRINRVRRAAQWILHLDSNEEITVQI